MLRLVSTTLLAALCVVKAANITIDDSQWSTPSLQLSKEGWNMLREGGANEFINATAVAEIMTTLDRFWNKSVSWTDEPGSWVNMVFNGTDVYLYGLKGPQQGGFRVLLDGETAGDYSAAAEEISYGQLLFEAHELSPDLPHSVRVVAGVGRLSIDRAVVTELGTVSASSAPSSTALRSPQASSTSKTNMSTTGSSAFDPSQLDWSKVNISLLPPDLPTALLSGYTPKEIFKLSVPYKFRWNGAAWFVVGLASLVAVAAIATIFCLLWNEQKRRRSQARAQDGESFLYDDESQGTGRSRRGLISALRSKKISGPITHDEDFDSQPSSAKTGLEEDKQW